MSGHPTTHCGSCKWPTQSVQRAGSITEIVSPCEIAWLGQAGSQTSQLTQSSLIFRDMARAVAAGQSGLHPFPSPSKEKAGMGMVLLQASLVARPSTPTRTLPLLGRASLSHFPSPTSYVHHAAPPAALPH